MCAQLLTDSEVLGEVRKLTAQGKVGWSKHSLERMSERGFDTDQVKECLVKGNFTENPVIPNKPGEIMYTFKISSTVDGEPISVAASLCPNRKVVVITVIAD